MAQRLPRSLPLLVALLLALQWGAGLAHCLQRLSVAAAAIAICTAEGAGTRHADPAGQPGAPGDAAHETCPFCPGATALPPPAPPALAARLAYAPVVVPRLAGLPPAPPRAPPQQPRAPPLA